MKKDFTFKMPVYFKKRGRDTLLSMNWYRNAHFREQNTVKKYFEFILKGLMIELSKDKVEYDRYSLAFIYHYKASNSDLDNVVALGLKFINDALKGFNLIKDDNVTYMKSFKAEVGNKVRNTNDACLIVTLSLFKDGE